MFTPLGEGQASIASSTQCLHKSERLTVILEQFLVVTKSRACFHVFLIACYPNSYDGFKKIDNINKYVLSLHKHIYLSSTCTS